MLCFKTDYILAKTRVLERKKYYLFIHPSKPFHFIHLFIFKNFESLILLTSIWNCNSSSCLFPKLNFRHSQVIPEWNTYIK